MSEAFYRQFIGLLFKFMLCIIGDLVIFQFSLFFLLSGNPMLYILLAILGCSVFVYTLFSYISIRDLQDRIHLFIPLAKPKEVDPLPISSDQVKDVGLKVCVLYASGLSFPKIQKELGLKRYQIGRLLRKGLDVLLKEHNGSETHDSTIRKA